MKKITITFIALFFGVQINSFAQNIDEIREKIHEASKSETFLKEFDSFIKPYGEIKSSIVLSKNRLYKWYTYVNDPDQLQITLYDSHKNILFQNKSDTKGVLSFSTKCNKTAVYHMYIKNLSDKEVSNIVLMTFAGMFEPKDKEKIMPIVEQTETINQPKLEYAEKDKSYFFVVDEMPKFKGKKDNNKEFREFINQEIKYPQEAIDKKIEGRVFVQFVIGTDGYIKDAKVVRGVHPSIDQEALRLVYSFPKWESGIKDKEAVDVMFTFPIEFKLP